MFTWETEAEGSQVQGSSRPQSKLKTKQCNLVKHRLKITSKVGQDVDCLPHIDLDSIPQIGIKKGWEERKKICVHLMVL